MKTSSPHRAEQHIEWSSVALFYAIALGGAAVIIDAALKVQGLGASCFHPTMRAAGHTPID